jgi:hypothetical protein
MALKGLGNVRKALGEVEKPLNKHLRGIFLQGLGNIAGGGPVDEGRARSNWFLKIGSPSNKTTKQINGDPHLGRMSTNVLGKKIFYTNNLPYISKLEYGGFPGNGPKTALGYSDQAVGGWVRVELLRMRKGIRAIK